MIIKGYLRCPECNHRLQRIDAKSVISSELYCPKCSREFDVLISGMKIYKMLEVKR
jgi:DNA-directed RNA polymerase subunit RPC12/RpoP